jgi:hypothetical protein
MTVFLTNWSSRKLHGPGRKLTIMAKPRAWEHGEGTVRELVPAAEDLEAIRSGRIDLAEYRRRYFAMLGPADWQMDDLKPGSLGLRTSLTPVQDGDTLLCACSKEAASKGECHRVWAAEALQKAGWNVVLDGVPLSAPVPGA